MRKMSKDEAKRNIRQLMLVQFPPPVSGDAELPTGGSVDQEWGGIQLLIYCKRTQPQFTSDREGLDACTRINIAVDGKKNDDPIYLEWQDLWRLLSALDKPRNGYPIHPPERCIPFIEALEDAEEYVQTPPDEAKAEAKVEPKELPPAEAR